MQGAMRADLVEARLYLPKLSGEASPPALFIQSDSLTSAECRGFAPRIFEKIRPTD